MPIEGREQFALGIYADYLTEQFSFEDLVRERKNQLGRIAALRERCVLVMAADFRSRLAGLTADDLLPIDDQLSNLQGDALDLVLETPGGSGEAAEDIVRLIRRKFSSVGIVVPGTAKSAGTIMAMSGNDILMSHESALGPIDAQITQKGKVFSAHALLTGMDQIKEEIEKTGQLNKAYIPMLQNLSPGELEHARNAQAFAVGLVRDWLVCFKFKSWTVHSQSGMPVTPEDKEDRAAEIAEALSNHGRWKTHSRSITLDKLRDLGLLVTDYGEHAELADAIRRYYVLLRMTFDTNIYKLFETTTSQIVRFENVAPVPAETPQDAKNAKNAFVETACKKCGTKLKVQASLGEPSPIEPGCQPFPADDRLQCPACGVEINLAQARRQVEAQGKKRVLTPLSAQTQQGGQADGRP